VPVWHPPAAHAKVGLQQRSRELPGARASINHRCELLRALESAQLDGAASSSGPRAPLAMRQESDIRVCRWASS